MIKISPSSFKTISNSECMYINSLYLLTLYRILCSLSPTRTTTADNVTLCVSWTLLVDVNKTKLYLWVLHMPQVYICILRIINALLNLERIIISTHSTPTVCL